MQIAFARLAGDAAARARFASAPYEESVALFALEPRMLESFATGVLAKRYHEVRQLLPGCARSSDFRARFATYAA